MTVTCFTLQHIIRSSRLLLWLPVMSNVVLLVLAIGHSFHEGFVIGFSLCCLATYGYLINDIWDRSIDHDNNANKLDSAPAHVIVSVRIASGIFLTVGLGLAS